jgi:hypothetical protein
MVISGKAVMLAAAVLFAAAANCGVKWTNLDDSHRLGGRKVSEGYLQGKVVLVARWSAKSLRGYSVLPRMEEVWRNFKTKPFVLLGSHCVGSASPSEVRSLLEENGVTFPVYEGAAHSLVDSQSQAFPFFYVVDATGKVVYSGTREHNAVQAVVISLTDLQSPRNDVQLSRYLEFEIDELPASAHLRLKNLREKDPLQAARYESQWRQLDSDPQVKKVSRIVEVTRRLKDFAPKTPADTRRYPSKIREALSRFSNLKDITDPRLLREAKNSIAELKWLEASL